MKIRIKIIILIITCVLFSVLGYYLYVGSSSNEESIDINDEYYSEWDKYYEINNDYIGHIVFDSNIINLPVLQANDNDYYLRRNINKEYDIKGIPFIDYRCSLNDQNIIIYGHYIKKGSQEMFTPLEKLIDSRDNDSLQLRLRTSIRQYKLVSILIVDGENNDNYPFLLQNYSQSEINILNDYIKENSIYSSNDSITLNDSILTLITCTNDMNEFREIAIFKEI